MNRKQCDARREGGDQTGQPARRRLGESPSLLYRSPGFREEGGLQPMTISLAHGGLAGEPGRHGVAAGALTSTWRPKPTSRRCSSKASPRQFFTDDLQADYARMKARGVEFTMPLTERDRFQDCQAVRHLRQ